MLSNREESRLNSAFSNENKAFADDLKKAATAQLREEMEPGRWKRFWPGSDYNTKRRAQNTSIDGMLYGEPTQLLDEEQKASVIRSTKEKLTSGTPVKLSDQLEAGQGKEKFEAQRAFIREHGTDSKKDARNALEVMSGMENAQQVTKATEYLDSVKNNKDKNKYPSGYRKALLDRSEGREVLELAAKKPEQLAKFEELDRDNKFPLSTRQHLKVARICASADSPEAAEARHKFIENECKRSAFGRVASALSGDRYDQKNLTILNDKFKENDSKTTPDAMQFNTDGSKKRDRLEMAAGLVSKYPHLYEALNEAYGGEDKMTNRQFIKAVQQIGAELKNKNLPVTDLEQLNSTLANKECREAFADNLKGKVESNRVGIKVEVIRGAVKAANNEVSPTSLPDIRSSAPEVRDYPSRSSGREAYPSNAHEAGRYGVAPPARENYGSNPQPYPVSMGGGSTDARGHGAAPAERAGSAWPTTADYAAMPAVGGGAHTDAPATSRAAAVQEGVSGSYRSADDAVNAMDAARGSASTGSEYALAPTRAGNEYGSLELATQYARNSLLGRPERLAEFDAMNDFSKSRIEERFQHDRAFRDDFMKAMQDGKSIKTFGEELFAKQAQAAAAPTGGFPPNVASAATDAARGSAGRMPAGSDQGQQAGDLSNLPPPLASTGLKAHTPSTGR